MDPKLLSRLGMGVCLVLSVLLVIFFFFNWVEAGPPSEEREKAAEAAEKLSIEYDESATSSFANGFQLSFGTITMPEKTPEDL